ncbi:ion channel [Membranihabitans maritimus]|uniref:ion channel n=1 Tax=Membranihabitans maritimus TaxID=2904244 RepID=UPI001F37CE0E|nr:ion channel [Membranihabitans maritimus]
MYKYLENRKYEVLLTALILHLYIGIFLSNLLLYIKVIWPINMVILGIASLGIYLGKGRSRTQIKNVLLLLVIALPISIPFFSGWNYFMPILSFIYCLFFGYIFIDIFKFLVKPGYINTDIISASICGFFLIIEMAVFLLQGFYYLNSDTFTQINETNPATVFMDLVYFSTITVTTVGFGDISPDTYSVKLIVSVLTVISHFYTVVLIGILISKFSSNQNK